MVTDTNSRRRGQLFGPKLLALGVALLPIYVFSSGGQPSHLILALFSITLLLNRGFPSEVSLFFLSGVAVYSFFVESFYVTIGANPTSLMASVFFSITFSWLAQYIHTAAVTGCRPSRPV